MPTALIEPEPSAQDAEPSSNLSSRETAILNALVQGASNKIIAYRLSITEATVKVHVKAILRKIQVRNRTQAAIWALHHQTMPKPVHETRCGLTG
jgi:two-component system nitrate/nitrite response regulator NarL